MFDARWWHKRKACLVLVHTKDGRSIKGHIAEVTRRAIILRAAAMVEPTGDQPMAGEVGIPAANVSSWQDLGQVDP